MKFNNDNLKGRTIECVNELKTCRVCDCSTQYVDYTTGSPYCSEECYDSSMEMMSQWANAGCCDDVVEIDKERVEISRERYEQLLFSDRLLGCLNACGVDNWEGYSDAFEMMNDEE